jgi:hypothetical protein
MQVGDNDQYIVRVDGSRRLTLRNRRFLRKMVQISQSFPQSPLDITQHPPITSATQPPAAETSKQLRTQNVPRTPEPQPPVIRPIPTPPPQLDIRVQPMELDISPLSPLAQITPVVGMRNSQNKSPPHPFPESPTFRQNVQPTRLDFGELENQPVPRLPLRQLKNHNVPGRLEDHPTSSEGRTRSAKES